MKNKDEKDTLKILRKMYRKESGAKDKTKIDKIQNFFELKEQMLSTIPNSAVAIEDELLICQTYIDYQERAMNNAFPMLAILISILGIIISLVIAKAQALYQLSLLIDIVLILIVCIEFYYKVSKRSEKIAYYKFKLKCLTQKQKNLLPEEKR